MIMQTPRWLLEILKLIQNKPQKTSETESDSPSILEKDAPDLDLPQTAPWAKTTVMAISAGLSILALWSVFARLDVVVAARGKLEPQSSSQVVQSKRGGTVTSVTVTEGQRVQRGQVLMQLDTNELTIQQETLSQQRKPLVQQIAVLRSVRQGTPIAAIQKSLAYIPPELVNQAQNRQLLVAQITGDPTGLSPDQMQRFQLNQQRMADLQAISELQASTLSVQGAGANSTVRERASRVRAEQQLVANLEPLAQQGAISRRDYITRVLDVNQLQDQLNQSRVQQRELTLGQAQAQVDGRSQLRTIIQDSQTQLAQLDAQLDARIEQASQQLISIEGQLTQLKGNLANQELRSPVDGFVFDLKTRIPGFFASPGQELLKVAPDETLVARLQIANTDIGELRVNQEVDLRIDAFPFTEFGAIKGVITRIGSDAIPANPQTPNSGSVFPVEVRLLSQQLENGKKRIDLTPGMTISGNIKVRDRAPISLVFDRFVEILDPVKSVR